MNHPMAEEKKGKAKLLHPHGESLVPPRPLSYGKSIKIDGRPSVAWTRLLPACHTVFGHGIPPWSVRNGASKGKPNVIQIRSFRSR